MSVDNSDLVMSVRAHETPHKLRSVHRERRRFQHTIDVKAPKHTVEVIATTAKSFAVHAIICLLVKLLRILQLRYSFLHVVV